MAAIPAITIPDRKLGSILEALKQNSEAQAKQVAALQKEVKRLARPQTSTTVVRQAATSGGSSSTPAALDELIEAPYPPALAPQFKEVPAGATVAWPADVTTIPGDWFLCDGTLKNIAEEPNLYAAIGTTWGGDGVTTFALPPFTRMYLQGASSDSTEMAGTILGANDGTYGAHFIDFKHSHAPGTLITDAEYDHSHTADGTLATDTAYDHTHAVGTLANATTGAHTHTTSALSTGTAGAHDHGGNTGAPSASENVTAGITAVASATHLHTITSDGGHTHTIGGATDSAGDHTHTISGATADGGSHSHDVTGNTGEAGYHQHLVVDGRTDDALIYPIDIRPRTAVVNWIIKR